MDEFKKVTVREVAIRGLKKMISEMTSLKFWALALLGYLIVWVVLNRGTGLEYLILAFLALLGIREGFDYLSAKIEKSSFETIKEKKR